MSLTTICSHCQAKALVGDASVTVLGLLSRDFDRGVRPELRAAE